MVPSSTFSGRGRTKSDFWTPEHDHALLEAHALAGPIAKRFGKEALPRGVDWCGVALLFAAMTGHFVSQPKLTHRWRAIIADMDVDLMLTRAVISMADEEAARALTPPPVPVAPSWPGLELPIRASIAPSQERMHI